MYQDLENKDSILYSFAKQMKEFWDFSYRGKIKIIE